MVNDWLLQPTITNDPEPLPYKPGGDPAEFRTIIVPGFGHFFVMRPVTGSVREEFVDNICRHLYGDVYEWYEADTQV